MQVYYARSKNALGQQETAVHHLGRAGTLCGQFLSEISYEDWGEIIGKLHDLGKLSPCFQMVLTGQKAHMNHALPGAAIGQELQPEFLSAVIASHHCQLQSAASYSGIIHKSRQGNGDRLDEQNNELSLFGPEEYRQALDVWGKAFRLHRLRPAPDFSRTEDPLLSKMLFTRLLFSALVDADWSSSAEHFEPDYLKDHSGPALDAPACMERLLALRQEKQRVSASSAALNRLRDSLFDACLEAGNREPGLFTLTAPTGLGKTLSLLAFALQHCIRWNKRRIILVLPYLTILEQNCQDYRKIIPELLEIHSQAPWTEGARQLADRWDAPCIVTTNVSFLEPLFSAQPGSCRHLHQLANSVIVLDEAQTLPPELLDATLRTIKELCDRYGCTVVFSTATQPSFQHRPGLSWSPREIAPAPAALFNATRRVRWVWQTKQETALGEIAEELSRYNQCCVIVNLKRHARALLQTLSARCPDGCVFYLSTDLCPAHRTAVLEQVRERLAQHLPCRLVATQCVEAGCDLDFPVVYRALAPLDALIQAAGRCNRNGDSPEGLVKIFIPDEAGRLYPTAEYERGALCVRTLLARHAIDCCDLSHIAEYYQLLYGSCDGDKAALRAAIQGEDYPETQRQYRIVEQSGVSVIVPYAGALEHYRAIRDRLDQEGLSAALLRSAQDLTVNTFDRKAVQQYCQRLCFRARETGLDEPTDIYLLGNPAFYNEKQGLHFDELFDRIL